MKVQCQCGATYNLAPNFAGKQVRCKKCSGNFRVPPTTSGTSAQQRRHPPNANQRKKPKTAADRRREKEDALLAEYSGKPGKTSTEDFIADNFRDSFEEDQHSGGVMGIVIGIACLVLAPLLFVVLNMLENGGVAPRIVWVFVMLYGKYWAPPLLFLFGLLKIVLGVLDMMEVNQKRKSRR